MDGCTSLLDETSLFQEITNFYALLSVHYSLGFSLRGKGQKLPLFIPQAKY